MQVNFLDDAAQVADFLEKSTVLTTLDYPGGLRVSVAEFNGQDVLAVQGVGEGAVVIYGPEAFDAESGGGIHDHARMIYSADATPAA